MSESKRKALPGLVLAAANVERGRNALAASLAQRNDEIRRALALPADERPTQKAIAEVARCSPQLVNAIHSGRA